MNNTINRATIWSFITEILSKLVAPITNMLLARLLTPDIFGIVATITIVTSFAELYADAGFQKYLIQRNFKSEDDFLQNVNTAFWINFCISMLLWVIIVVFRDDLAYVVGSEGYGSSLGVASSVIPLYAFYSIQIAIFRKALDFKTIFKARFVGILVPFFVTVPIAFITHSHWSLIIGNIVIQIANVYYLNKKSKWKPSFRFSFSNLKEMWNFSIWTLIEQLLGWFNLNIGVFIVGTVLSTYYLGLYKMSISTVNQIMSVVANSISPVLLSSLSKSKIMSTEYYKVYFYFNKIVSAMLMPMGIGVFIYRDFITILLLGDQWVEASNFIGLWALCRAIHAAYTIFSMELFISIGKPVYAVISQLLSLTVLIPTLLFFSNFGYGALYTARSFEIFITMSLDLILMYIAVKISVIQIIKNVYPCMIASLVMTITAYLLKIISSWLIWNVISIVICAIVYICVLCIWKDYRELLFNFFNKVQRRRIK